MTGRKSLNTACNIDAWHVYMCIYTRWRMAGKMAIIGGDFCRLSVLE